MAEIEVYERLSTRLNRDRLRRGKRGESGGGAGFAAFLTLAVVAPMLIALLVASTPDSRAGQKPQAQPPAQNSNSPAPSGVKAIEIKSTLT